MPNIKINEAETIFEVFWEGRLVNSKWCSLLDQYDQYPNGVAEFCYSNWTAQTKIMPGLPSDHVAAVMERECMLEITGYDRMKMFAGIDQTMHFKMICCIDGVDTEIYNLDGRGVRCEYEAPIKGSLLTKIRMEYQDTSGKGAISQIVWLGLSNSQKEQNMLAEKTPYTEDWPGFLSDTPTMEPQLNLFFDHTELAELREKIKLPGFSQWMDSLREEANKEMQIVPENEVGQFVIRRDRRFVRDRDMNRPSLFHAMESLAFVGIVDENPDMLKMACRMALAICHSEHFFESIMGHYPGVTWHHLCFTEGVVCENLVKVLDWAGGFLNERGRNLIYQSILTKGLPIIDKSIKTNDDVWVCNQGLVFENSLITVLAALQKRWPRYASRLEEAEKDFFQMWEIYTFSDGGSGEGPAYWSYTMNNIIDVLYLLARIHQKPIQEFVPDLAKKIGDYANALLSEVDNGLLPVNDTHPGGQFSLKIVQFLAQIGAGEIWKHKSNEIRINAADLSNSLIWAKLYDVTGQPRQEEFVHLPVTGITKVRRTTDDLGAVAFYTVSGAAIWGHSHADKGSFILEADNTPLLIDRGCCDYHKTYHVVIVNAEVHNVLAAVSDGIILNQGRVGAQFSGTVLNSEYVNGSFAYSTDVTAPWNGAFAKNIRNISSPNPYLYLIEDEAELETGDGICFILNTYGQITQEGENYLITDSGKQVVVHTQNWKPTHVEMGLWGEDGEGRPVNRLCLYCFGRKSYHLLTSLTLSRTTESKE